MVKKKWSTKMQPKINRWWWSQAMVAAAAASTKLQLLWRSTANEFNERHCNIDTQAHTHLDLQYQSEMIHHHQHHQLLLPLSYKDAHTTPIYCNFSSFFLLNTRTIQYRIFIKTLILSIIIIIRDSISANIFPDSVCFIYMNDSEAVIFFNRESEFTSIPKMNRKKLGHIDLELRRRWIFFLVLFHLPFYSSSKWNGIFRIQK